MQTFERVLPVHSLGLFMVTIYKVGTNLDLSTIFCVLNSYSLLVTHPTEPLEGFVGVLALRLVTIRGDNTYRIMLEIGISEQKVAS